MLFAFQFRKSMTIPKGSIKGILKGFIKGILKGYIKGILKGSIKGILDVISSDPKFLELQVKYAAVPFKPLSGQR